MRSAAALLSLGDSISTNARIVSTIAGNRSWKYRSLSAQRESRFIGRFADFFVPFIRALLPFPERLPAQAVQYNRHAVEGDYE
jgi:hypothetical protein